MQLIVLGMHRSGTSAVCRILNMMGAYFGPEGSSIGFTAENPKGFWERKDILKMNDNALLAAKADWYKVADFNCATVPDRIKDLYTVTAKSIVHELDAHRPWVIKEPRLCLLLPLFLPVLEVPICIHVYRNPLQVAQSLKTRNGFPLSFGTALWEKYTLSALSDTRGLSNVLISYDSLIEKPVETVQSLFEELVSMGIQGLKCPIDKEIKAFIDPSLCRERGDPNLMKKEYLNIAQIKLFRSIENNSVFNYKKIPNLSAGALDVLRNFEVQDKSIQCLSDLHLTISAILNSRRWRVGNFLGTWMRKALFRPKVTMAADHIKEIIEKINTWEETLIKNALHGNMSSSKEDNIIALIDKENDKCGIGTSGLRKKGSILSLLNIERRKKNYAKKNNITKR